MGRKRTVRRTRDGYENTARLEMNPAGLYREEIFTDREAGTIRVLTPVKTDGLIDATRSVLYLGEAQILTAAGVLPLGFEIGANSLAQPFRGSRPQPRPQSNADHLRDAARRRG